MSTKSGDADLQGCSNPALDFTLRTPSEPEIPRIRPIWAEELALFRYKPINVDSGELRVLTLLQGSKDDVLDCKIQHRLSGTNDEDSSYTALSYTWGKPVQYKPIVIDGCLHYVTDYLEIAPRNPRKEDKASSSGSTPYASIKRTPTSVVDM